MRYKVSELKGALLDAAVAKAEGLRFRIGRDTGDSQDTCWLHEPLRLNTHYPESSAFDPSTHWGDGGPIIERERMNFEPGSDGVVASYGNRAGEFGRTYLIAAMRAYVASKFGEQVDI